MEVQRQEIVGHKPGPHLLITGGVHGDEFEPMAACRRLIARLRADPPRGTVTVVPVANEPAFRRGSRVGDDGLDLARTCPGRPDGSVTERIAHDLSALIRAAAGSRESGRTVGGRPPSARTRRRGLRR